MTAIASDDPARFENRRYRTEWRLDAMRVFGGFRIVWRRWVRTADGWDYEAEDCSERSLYASEEAARAAIRRLGQIMLRADL